MGVAFFAFLMVILVTLYLNSKIKKLERRIEEIQWELRTNEIKKPGLAQEKALSEEPPEKEKPPVEIQAPFAPEPVIERAEAAKQPARSFHAPKTPKEQPQFVTFLKDLFTGGNLLVKIGVFVLFFGVSFLVKYAADHALFPIELRLSSAAAGGLIILIIGWRLRKKREGYALALQGGGVGILYLTTFAALHLYSLIPAPIAFFVLAALGVLSSALAILQDSRTLVVLGISGGFLAPVLASTGGGNHVLLFSYYALLNASIAGIAWFKSWRVLNVVGFLFTFIIGAAWGINYYRPEYFGSVEPFLILFFILYVAVCILFTLRQHEGGTGYVDGTLLFGTPIVGFSLQALLVKDFEYGMAWSALVVGFVYASLAWSLFYKKPKNSGLLTESFLAFGMVFCTLTVPLALDGRWTSAVWAVEGAAVLWLGVRQKKRWSRILGTSLQLCAGFFFINSMGLPTGGIPIMNGFFTGCALISIAGIFSSLVIYKNKEGLDRWEYPLSAALAAWGFLWWFGGGLNEIQRHLLFRYRPGASLVFIAASCSAGAIAAKRLEWQWLAYPAYGLLPVMYVFLINGTGHPLAFAGYAIWPLVYMIQYLLLYRQEDASETLKRLQHSGTLWHISILLAWEAAWSVTEWLGAGGAASWALIAWGIVPAALIYFIVTLGEKIAWPIRIHYETYLFYGAGPVSLYLLAWIIYSNLTSTGDPAPLPYLPLINPLDVAVGVLLAVLVEWFLKMRSGFGTMLSRIPPALIYGIFAAAVFVWLNAVVVRTVHYWGDVDFNSHSMFGSILLQASLSILWTLIALCCMVFATRKGIRALWLAGGTLLGAVVLKLFFIELSQTGTVARIVSFVVVGVLLLLIGYLSPVPPRVQKDLAV